MHVQRSDAVPSSADVERALIASRSEIGTCSSGAHHSDAVTSFSDRIEYIERCASQMA